MSAADKQARTRLPRTIRGLAVPIILVWVAFTAAVNLPSQRVMQKLGMTRDPADDFDHPRLPAEHPLRAHVLYRIAAPIG